jgi:hypothetical protein
MPLTRHRIARASVDLDHGRWGTTTVELPASPLDGSPVLLVPERFLNDLPATAATGRRTSRSLTSEVRSPRERARRESITRSARPASSRRRGPDPIIAPVPEGQPLGLQASFGGPSVGDRSPRGDITLAHHQRYDCIDPIPCVWRPRLLGYCVVGRLRDAACRAGDPRDGDCRRGWWHCGPPLCGTA